MQQVLKFIRRNKKNIYVLLVLSFLYFFTRLLFLMNLPIFNDEAIYLWWSKLSEKDLLIAVPLGRQPLFMWLIMIFSRFTADPLLGARLISVFAGFASMIGLFLLANELFRNKKNAFLTSLIYVFYPFAVVYDRLAIIDSLIGATAVWSLYITLILLKKRKIIYSILLGTILAIGIFAKTEGFLGIYLVPFSLIIFDFKKRKKYLLKTVGLLLLAVLISQALYSIVRYHPGYYRVLAVNGVIIYPAHDLLKLGINFIFQNFLKNLIVKVSLSFVNTNFFNIYKR
jgi:4-amino-4-deoxy-L-arabinose transferase-like glycosyltransferase